MLTLPVHALSLDDEAALIHLEASRAAPTALLSYVEATDRTTRDRAAQALGRLGSADALGLLTILSTDRWPEVREEAAHAFGLTPQSAFSLRGALATETDGGVRAALLRALGMQGETEDIELLLHALDTEGRLLRRDATVEAAAIALGRMALRQVDGITAPAITARLVAQRGRHDRAARRGAAFALARMKAPTVDDPGALFAWARSEGDPTTQAWLVRAAASLEDREADLHGLLDALAHDHDAGVRIAVARAGATWPGLPAMLQDPQVTVKRAAIATLAGEPTQDRLALLLPIIDAGNTLDAAERAQSEGDPSLVLAMDALAALTQAEALADPLAHALADHPVQAMLATMSARTDVAELADLALEHEDARVRSHAALQWADLVDDATALRPLLSSPDGVVVEIAREALAEAMGEPPPQAPQVDLAGFDLGQTRDILSARVQTSRGEIIVDLHPEEAPITVWNFATLAEDGYFDQLRIHRVVPDFVVQDGDPRGDGMGGPGWAIPDELNSLRYGEGAMGMALSGPDTGGSQWFITLSPQPHLDDGYTIFGGVVRGMEAAASLLPGDRIISVEIERR